MAHKVINSNKGFSELLMNYVLTRMGRQASFQPKEKDVFKGMGIAPSHEPQYMPLLDGMFEALKPLVESDASYEELSDALEVWRLKIENLTDRLYPLTSDEPIFAGSQFNSDFEYIDYPTDYKPLAENEGRTGYFHVCKEGEPKHEPIFEIGTYENGAFIPQAN